jgi:heme-degrading monooxygenase HmoA
MVTRVWHGRTKSSDSEAYLEFLIKSGVTDYMATPGNIEVRIWREKEGDVTHFYTVSTWKDLDSIKAFAGEDIEKARYYPEDKNFLLEFEPTVKHYEAFVIK